MANNSISLSIRNEKFWVLFLSEHKHIGRFSNLHYCTFNLHDMQVKYVAKYCHTFFLNISNTRKRTSLSNENFTNLRENRT